MKLRFLNYFTTGLLIMIFQNMNAQEPVVQNASHSVKEIDKGSKHYIHTEIGGRTFLVGSFNYEYMLYKQFSIGCGLGLIYIERATNIGSNNGTDEIGKALSIASTQMIYGNYFIGNK